MSTISEFKRSVVDSSFYREIPNLSAKHIFKYICSLALLLGVVAALATAVWLYVNVGQGTSATSAYVTATILGGLSAGVITVGMIVVGLLLYPVVLALVVMLIALLLKKKVSYPMAYKYSIYALSTPLVLAIISLAFPALGSIMLVIEIVLFVTLIAVNLKKI